MGTCSSWIVGSVTTVPVACSSASFSHEGICWSFLPSSDSLTIFWLFSRLAGSITSPAPTWNEGIETFLPFTRMWPWRMICRAWWRESPMRRR